MSSILIAGAIKIYMNKRTSPIWIPIKEEFTKICKKYNTLADIIRYFGLQPEAGNYTTLNRRINKDKIDISHIKQGLNSNAGRIFTRKRLSKEAFLTRLDKNIPMCRSSVKQMLIRYNLIQHTNCNVCGINNTWNGKQLKLQLDHINGINNDNTLSNLRFICPNCHSQTETFSGKHKKRKIHNCIQCGKEIRKNSKRCKSCSNKFKQLIK